MCVILLLVSIYTHSFGALIDKRHSKSTAVSIALSTTSDFPILYIQYIQASEHVDICVHSATEIIYIAISDAVLKHRLCCWYILCTASLLSSGKWRGLSRGGRVGLSSLCGGMTGVSSLYWALARLSYIVCVGE